MARLKPRARIIRTIGDQLISGPEAAVIELVKNSYDAEATKVEINFSYRADEGFSITINDNGHGMTYDEILGQWLEPATDVKVKDKQSRTGKRQVLGAKGIGRFAVSRLGSVSMLTSVALNTGTNKTERSEVCIDWSRFTADEYLEDIEIDIEKEVLPTKAQTGVQIEITDLRDTWSKKRLEKLIIELRRLAHPFKNDVFRIYLDLECMTNETAGFDGKSVFDEQNRDFHTDLDEDQENANQIQPFSVGDIADYKVEGSFDPKGGFTGYFQIQRGDKTKQPIKLAPPTLSEDEAPCGPLSLKLNIYDREHDAIANVFERMGLNFEKIGIRRARKILTDVSGISISRNGFRIRPYGDPGHDWLDLQTKRVQDPSKKLGSDQVSGYVEIGDEKSSGIIERSSREGLELNPHYFRLKNLISNLLPHIEERRFDFRDKAGIGRRPSTNVDKARDAAKLRRTSRALDRIPEEFRSKIEAAIEKDATALNQMLDEVDDYQKVLQSRASLGLVVAEVIHEGRRLLDPMFTSTKALRSDWKHAFEKTEMGTLFREHFPDNIETMHKGAQGLSKLFKRLDPVSGRKRGRPSNFSVSTAISDAVAVLNHSLETNNISLDIDIPEKITCHGYREDLQASLLNIIENAIHWLSSVDNDERHLEISVVGYRKRVLIYVSNNGPEVDEAYQGRLFDAGFSLKSDGTGLGLAIAREACRASKGELSFDDSRPETTFVIEFPRG